jgi:alpha-galactosidase
MMLNYTNPMAMLCRAMQRESNIAITGLCHSVQGTAEMLAGWIGVPYEEIDYLCAGINHMAWYLRFDHKNQSVYPLIRAAMDKPEIYNSARKAGKL